MKILVEVPDNWKPQLGRLGGMIDCPIRGCQEVMMCAECQIANAVKAVEVSSADISLFNGAIKISAPIIQNGKPVKLYAVEEE